MKQVRYFSILFFAILFIGLTSCRKEKASWISDWVVPLVNDSLTLTNFIQDSILGVNSDNSIQVIMHQNLINLDLTDVITIPDTTIEQIMQLSFGSITVQPGMVFFDEVKQHSFDFGDGALKEALIKSGYVKVIIENPINAEAIFTISLPGVIKDGVEFSLTKNVGGGTPSNPGIGTFEFDFAGYTINMSGINGDGYNTLQSKLTVKTNPNGSAITITSQDKFKTRVSFENLKVHYGRGYFGNHQFADNQETHIDFLDKIVGGQINIEDLNLELIISNGIKATAQGKLNLFESTNSQGNTVALTHPYFGQYLNLNPAQGQWSTLQPSELVFAFNSSSGNMKEFLENLGNKYRVGYDIQINPLENTSMGHNVIYPNSKLALDLRANFPLKIGADSLTLRDTFAIDLKNNGKALRIESGELILKAKNSFPYGATAYLTLLDEDGNNLTSLAPIGLISPALINESGNGHDIIESELRFIVNEETANLMADVTSIVVTAVFNSTQFNNNKVYLGDKIQFVLLGQFNLRVKI